MNTEPQSTQPTSPRYATALLALSMFFTGACGLVAEYILGTVSTYILGNSIEQFSVVIAIMLLMMGLAGFAQNYIKDTNLIEKFITVEILLSLMGGFAPIGLYAAFSYTEAHFMLIMYFFMMAIGALIGLEIPLVLRINKKYRATLQGNLASIYAPDYIGAFIGFLVWIYLLKRIPVTEISFVMASVNFVVAVVAFIYFTKHKLVRHKIVFFVLIALTAGALFFGYLNNRGWNRQLEQRLYDHPIVLARTTKYQRIVMTHNQRISEYRFFINGNLQFSSSDEKIYHEQLVHPVMNMVNNHSQVLVLGGGDGLALREILKYKDVKNITLVDLDPDMVKIASTDPCMRKLNKNAFHDSRVFVQASKGVIEETLKKTVYQETGRTARGRDDAEMVAEVNVFSIDADLFIQDLAHSWNVIIIDFPDPNSVELCKLYSKSFYLKLKQVLSQHGMVVIQSTSPYHAKKAFLNIRRTMEAAGLRTLPYHDNVPSFGDWGWLLAWKSDEPQESVRKRLENLEAYRVPTEYLTPEVSRGALIFGKGILQSKSTDINTIMNPTLLKAYIDESWGIE
ncbi:MAG: polyamine aminopropyltransferase [bacterium]|nr:polyamine aminopropyltransferase [bacterium]